MIQLTKARRIVLQIAAAGILSVGSLVLPYTPASANAAPSFKPESVAPAPAPNLVTAPVPGKATNSNAQAQNPAMPWTVSLTASATFLWPTQFTTLTATANQSVSLPSPYYISIYDVTAHTYIGICGSGTSCAVSVTQPTAMTHQYVGYVSLYPITNPPAGLQATSSTVTVTWRSLTVNLQASPTTLAVNGTATLTATTSVDVGPTPFWTQIYDTATGARLVTCGASNVCTATISKAMATTDRFVAFVAKSNTPALPPAGLQATSNSSYVTWTGGRYRVSLAAARTSFGHDTLTATSNTNVGPTPYYIEIYNEKTGALVTACGNGTICTIPNVALSLGQNQFVAFVASYSTTLPPANIQASSNVILDNFTLPIVL